MKTWSYLITIQMFASLCVAPVSAQDILEATPETPSLSSQSGLAPSPEPAMRAAADSERDSTEDGTENLNNSFKDWALECFGESNSACQTVHRVIAGDASQVVVVMALASPRPDAPVNVQISLPLGIDVVKGVRMAIGNEYQASIPIARCTSQGCLLEGTASDALLAAMRVSQGGQFTVYDETGQSFDLPFSLMGFTDSFSEMTARNAQ